MTSLSAHEVTRSRDCKTPGCPWPAASATGLNAGLCRSCARAAQETRRPPGANGEITAAARRLASASAQLESALTAIYKREEKLADADRAWRAALADLLRVAKPYLR